MIADVKFAKNFTNLITTQNSDENANIMDVIVGTLNSVFRRYCSS